MWIEPWSHAPKPALVVAPKAIGRDIPDALLQHRVVATRTVLIEEHLVESVPVPQCSPMRFAHHHRSVSCVPEQARHFVRVMRRDLAVAQHSVMPW